MVYLQQQSIIDKCKASHDHYSLPLFASSHPPLRILSSPPLPLSSTLFSSSIRYELSILWIYGIADLLQNSLFALFTIKGSWVLTLCGFLVFLGKIRLFWGCFILFSPKLRHLVYLLSCKLFRFAFSTASSQVSVG